MIVIKTSAPKVRITQVLWAWDSTSTSSNKLGSASRILTISNICLRILPICVFLFEEETACAFLIIPVKAWTESLLHCFISLIKELFNNKNYIQYMLFTEQEKASLSTSCHTFPVTSFEALNMIRIFANAGLFLQIYWNV